MTVAYIFGSMRCEENNTLKKIVRFTTYTKYVRLTSKNRSEMVEHY